jgi:ectoine hydroxylase-related dioxygenase (phytanoyl-CoA dioxygenase family)
MVSDFKEKGFCLEKNVFTPDAVQILSSEFDRIVYQLQRSGEYINARWGSELTKDIEQSDTQVIHTHNVQSYSAEMMSMIQDERLLDTAEKLIGQDIILHHSKLFLKPPGNGSAFPLHQDWSYFPTEKNSMIAAVIHLTESDEQMGCMRIVPGSHRLGQIEKTDGHSFVKGIHDRYQLEDAEPIIAEPGDVVFFHCCSLHGSMQNVSKRPRKTVLVQLYSGSDRVVDGNRHTNVQLVLRGVNHFATRSGVDTGF